MANLNHAFREANRLAFHYRDEQNPSYGQRRKYFTRVFVKYLIDRKLEYWHWAGWLCYRYHQHVIWVSYPIDDYTRVVIDGDYNMEIYGQRLVHVVKTLRSKGFI